MEGEKTIILQLKVVVLFSPEENIAFCDLVSLDWDLSVVFELGYGYQQRKN